MDSPGNLPCPLRPCLLGQDRISKQQIQSKINIVLFIKFTESYCVYTCTNNGLHGTESMPKLKECAISLTKHPKNHNIMKLSFYYYASAERPTCVGTWGTPCGRRIQRAVPGCSPSVPGTQPGASPYRYKHITGYTTPFTHRGVPRLTHLRTCVQLIEKNETLKMSENA